MCGDQKYLELFEVLYKDEVHEIDKIGHGAPWNLHMYQYKDKKNIIYEEKDQIMVYVHFSQFGTDFAKNTYSPSSGFHGFSCYNNIPQVKEIYDEYFNKLKNVKEKYNL